MGLVHRPLSGGLIMVGAGVLVASGSLDGWTVYGAAFLGIGILLLGVVNLIRAEDGHGPWLPLPLLTILGVLLLGGGAVGEAGAAAGDGSVRHRGNLAARVSVYVGTAAMLLLLIGCFLAPIGLAFGMWGLRRAPKWGGTRTAVVGITLNLIAGLGWPAFGYWLWHTGS